MAGGCATNCTSEAQCQSGFHCAAGRCQIKSAPGASCTASVQCASGFCVDGVCCASGCTESCHACNVAGALGTCTAVPSGQDPRGQCPAQAAATCGRAGGCNGQGACLLHPAGTECARSCAAAAETASQCNGLGACVAGAARPCAPYLCGSGACATACTSSAACTPGYSCTGSACVPMTGLVLHWRFEEPNGTVVGDSSGNNLHGAATGAAGAPMPSAAVPPGLSYANGRSRVFSMADRHAVLLANMPAALKPANNLTISVWYRATAMDVGGGGASGSEIVSAGNAYLLRLRSTGPEVFKEIAGNSTVYCRGTPGTQVDGNWHHLAAVFSTTGFKLFFDGAVACTSTRGENIAYSNPDVSPDLWVGRHGFGQTTWDFGGNVDELRIYNRVFTDAEIAALAAGGN